MKSTAILNPNRIHLRKLSTSAIPIMLIFMASCASQSSNSMTHQSTRSWVAGTDEDKQAIETIYQNWYTAWDTKDHKLASQGYSNDAIWVNAFGTRCVGREEIEETLKMVFGMSSVMAGKSKTVEKATRFIDSDVALVTSRIERVGQQMQTGEMLPTRHTSHLRVFVKAGGRWQIISHLISDARSKDSSDH